MAILVLLEVVSGALPESWGSQRLCLWWFNERSAAVTWSEGPQEVATVRLVVSMWLALACGFLARESARRIARSITDRTTGRQQGYGA